MKLISKPLKPHAIAIGLVAAIVGSAGATSVYKQVNAVEDKASCESSDSAALKSHDAKGHSKSNALTQELGLDATQEKAFDDAKRKFFEGMGPVFRDQSLSKEQKHAKMAEHKEAFQAEMNKVLTPEQRTKFDEMVSRKHSQHGDKGEKHAQAKG